MPSEGRLIVPGYQGGAARLIRSFITEPMPGRPGYWHGRFELERVEDVRELESWRETRSRLAMPGLEGVTIQWTDYRRGVAYQYTGAALRCDGDGFIFEGAKRKP
jgi:hypothetical protein